MRTLITSVVLSLMPYAVYAQEEKPKVFYAMQGCGYWENIAIGLSKYQEKVLFTGNMTQVHASGTPYEGGMMMQVNQDTGTWSLISIWGDGTACVVAAGTGFEPYSR